MANIDLFEANELIRFYAQLVGTPDVAEDIKSQCNVIIRDLLKIVEPRLLQFKAAAHGIVTNN